MENTATALRRVWRKSTEHLLEQVVRFLRLTILAAAPSLIDLLQGGKFDKVTLWAFTLPVLEVAYRQMFPALGAKKADAAPGTVTTVGGPEPVNTDNGPRPEDGSQDEVSQDPSYVPPIVPEPGELEGESTDEGDLS